MSFPLPPNDRISFSERQAYALVLGFEARCVDDVYLPRILGYFLRELPASIGGPQNLAREILSCLENEASATHTLLSLSEIELYDYYQADEKLSHLARLLRNNLLCPCEYYRILRISLQQAESMVLSQATDANACSLRASLEGLR